MGKVSLKGLIVPNDEKIVYEWFGIDAVSPKDIETQINACKGEDIEVEINSPGGDVYSGSEIYYIFKSYVGNSKGKIVGVAASAAGVAAMGLKTLAIVPTGQFMIHNVSTYGGGDHRDFEHTAQVLKEHDAGIANAYILKTGLSQQELIDLMSKETYFNAQNALKYKFVDEIMFDDKMQLAANASRSSLLPKEVVNKIRNELIQNRTPLGKEEKIEEPRTAPVDLYKSKIANIERRMKSYGL